MMAVMRVVPMHRSLSFRDRHVAAMLVSVLVSMAMPLVPMFMCVAMAMVGAV